MNKKELLDDIKNDLFLDSINIENKLYEIPSLHAKYLKMFFNTKSKLNLKQKELSILYKEKYNKLKDGDDILSAKELIFMIQGDGEYSQLNYEVQVLTDLVDIIDRTVKKVNNLSFDVKNIIDYLKYIQGV